MFNAERKTGRNIYAFGGDPSSDLVDEVVEAMPQKYNTISKLEREIKPGENAIVLN